MSDAPSHGSLQAELWAVCAELERLSPAPVGAYRAQELAAAFDQLSMPSAADAQADPGASTAAAPRRDAEESIWSVWCDHHDERAKTRMVLGIGHLAAGDLDQARAVFDDLISRYERWAEAWNKRATVLFLLGLDAASVSDIRRTLELEPRHFGALGGLAQIGLRNGNPDAARAALEALLRINPGALGVAEVIDRLVRNAPRNVH